MSFVGKLATVMLIVGVSAGAAFWYYGNADHEQRRADTAEHHLKLTNNTISDIQTRQRDVAA